MSFLASVTGVVAAIVSTAYEPPAPFSATRWCQENIVFDDRSPIQGAFDIDRFPFLREIHDVCSPEHPAREVTLRGSAQWGKTVSVIQPVLGAWHEHGAVDSLVVHPTAAAASEWVRTKWLPMRRQAPSLLKVFGSPRSGKGQIDNNQNMETLSRNGSIKIASAGSPSDLTGTSRRLVIMDDLSKYDATDKGDPEALAESRASGFDEAKILRVSTAMIKGTCRISLAYARSDQRLFFVPCPHCGHMQPLTWENFLSNIDPENLAAAGFSCEHGGCGKKITHAHKAEIMRAGCWVAQNPNGDHPGFHLWRAYSPLRDWASIAYEYARLRGWSRISGKAKVDDASYQVGAETEQVFFNDVLGLPFEQASDAPDWEALRDRTEHADPAELHVLRRGVLPASGVLFCAGVDCQDDRTEVHLQAFGANRQRWTVDYKTIPHHIGDSECRDALNAILRQKWRTEFGQLLPIDCLAIDGGTYTDDVWDWAVSHPWSRVIIVKGGSNQNGPLMIPQKLERRKDGKQKRRQKRAFILNVSMMKGQYFKWLHQDDPAERGYMNFARGMGDEYYRQITSERRILSRLASGVLTAKWVLVEPSRRNEGLDTANYAEAAARRKGWASMTDSQWDELAAARGKVVDLGGQGDLFDASADQPEGVSISSDADGVEVLASDAPVDGGGDPSAAQRARKLEKLQRILGNG